MKAAMAEGLDLPTAKYLFKQALDTPSLGSQLGGAVSQIGSNELAGVTGLADKFKNFNWGGAASNAVKSVKKNVGDALPGIQSSLKSRAGMMDQLKGMGDFARTNAIPNAMGAINQQGPKAVGDILQQHGSGMVGAFGQLHNSQFGAGMAGIDAGGELAKYFDAGKTDYHDFKSAPTATPPNPNSLMAHFNDYFTKGQGTNAINAMEGPIKELRNSMGGPMR